MSSGHGMHHRRSSGSFPTVASATSQDEDDVVVLDGNGGGTTKVSLVNKTPSRDELLKELVKKKTTNKKIGEIITDILNPIAKKKKEIVDRVKGLPDSPANRKIVQDVEAATPNSIRKGANSTTVATHMLDIHAALLAYVEAMEAAGLRVVKLIQEPFDSLDVPMQMAVSNWQADQYSTANSLFPKLTPEQRNRKFLENGFLPRDNAHRFCISCHHPSIDEPNTNKGLQVKHEKALRDHQTKKKAEKEKEAKDNSYKAKRMTAPKLYY